MYGKENEGTITKLIVTMLLIVLVLMIGYSIYKVEHSEVIQKENIKKVLKVEDWEENNHTFEIDNLEKIEFVLDANGSNTDVKYEVTFELKNADNIKLYEDEYHLYESENILTGTIKYKETMKEKITLYLEKQNVAVTPNEENSEATKPTLQVTVQLKN